MALTDAIRNADAIYFGATEADKIYAGDTLLYEGFSPADIAGLALWVEADAGTSTTTDGAAVSTWNDQSGNDRHITGSGSTRPVYKADILNGKPVLRFDGVDDVLAAGSGATIQHVFVVASYTKNVEFSEFDGLVTGTSDGDSQIVLVGEVSSTHFFDSAITTAYHKNGTAFTEGDMQAPFTTPAVLSISSTGFANPLTVQIGKERVNSSRFWGGDVAAVLGYETVLSAGNRQAIEAYLGSKYGIAVS